MRALGASGGSVGDVSLSERSGSAKSRVSDCAKTDRETFGRLYEAHYTPILNYIYRCTLNITVAEDLASNTFFKALRGLNKYSDHGLFGPWLYRIATNEIRMHWRSAHTRDGEELRPDDLARVTFAPGELEASEEVEERMRRFSQLHECLQDLPERYRTVLVLRYLQGLRGGQIAQVVGKRTGTVKSLIHRGLKHLKRRIEARYATFFEDVHCSL